MMYETREEEVARKTAEAKAEGIAEEKEANVLGMLRKGYPLEDIAEIAKIGAADVRAIARKRGVKLP